MMMGYGMMLNMLFWIVLIGFAIYGFILLIMKPFEKNNSNNALTILKERFARGEIDPEEYNERKSLLKD
ncbi:MULTISPECIES: SHOCT domain-containing protein [Metabacillus]|uniref:SHOCT domain-containing protein n=1 Tax=Metabacillus TaxID=2675233 RepID=UPI001F25BB16|nr:MULTISPECIES: SHOCT domain-containing protein [Metabacillus]MCM3443358.1 SHOCT domain-containing protein [Metabacillus halosaccharovorans]